MADTETTPDAAQLDASTNEPTAPETDEGGKGSKSAILADLARERDARQAVEAELKALREAKAQPTEADKPDTGKSDVDRSADLERAVAAEAKAARLEVAIDKGLPKELAARLQGATREELEADADQLLKLVKSGVRSNVVPREGDNPRPSGAANATPGLARISAAYADAQSARR